MTSVSAPLVAKEEVAVAPKYAGPYELNKVVDACCREVKPTVDNVPLSVVFPATVSVPIVAFVEKRLVELAVPE